MVGSLHPAACCGEPRRHNRFSNAIQQAMCSGVEVGALWEALPLLPVACCSLSRALMRSSIPPWCRVMDSILSLELYSLRDSTESVAYVGICEVVGSSPLRLDAGPLHSTDPTYRNNMSHNSLEVLCTLLASVNEPRWPGASRGRGGGEVGRTCCSILQVYTIVSLPGPASRLSNHRCFAYCELRPFRRWGVGSCCCGWIALGAPTPPPCRLSPIAGPRSAEPSTLGMTLDWFLMLLTCLDLVISVCT